MVLLLDLFFINNDLITNMWTLNDFYEMIRLSIEGFINFIYIFLDKTIPMNSSISFEESLMKNWHFHKNLDNSHLYKIVDFIGLFSAAIAILLFITYNPVYSVLCMVFCFVTGSFLFFILRLDFFGYIFLIVYVGAIAVLFLFIVMMFDIKIKKNDYSLKNNKFSFFFNNFLIILLGFFTFLAIKPLYTLNFLTTNFYRKNREIINHGAYIDNLVQDTQFNTDKLTQKSDELSIIYETALMDTIEQGLNLEESFVTIPYNYYAESNLLHYINLLKIYNEFAPLLLLSGIILLIGMIGAIVLAMSSVSGKNVEIHGKSQDVMIKRQDTVQQFNRSAKVVRVIRESEIHFYKTKNAKFEN